VLRVLVDECALHVRDERLRPVGVAVREGGRERRVVVVGDVIQRRHGEVAAPVVVAGLERDRLRAERVERVRAGADRLGVGLRGRVIDRAPDVLGHHGGVEHLRLLHELRLTEGEDDVVPLHDDVGELQVAGVERGGVADEVEAEDDVVGGELLAVVPGHVRAWGDRELRVVVVPFNRLGQPRGGLVVAHEVDHRERFEDHVLVAELVGG
jgi:hypothetical protein